MNLDGKRSVNSILSSFCPDENDVLISDQQQSLSIHREPNNNNSAKVVLENSKHFSVFKNLIIHKYSFFF